MYKIMPKLHGNGMGTSPLVSISETGMGYINGSAMSKCPKDITGIEILLDKENKKIAFKPRKKGEFNVYSLIQIHENSPGRYISLCSLMKHLKLNAPQTKTRIVFDNVEWNNKLEALEIDLNSYKTEPTRPYRVKRKNEQTL